MSDTLTNLIARIQAMLLDDGTQFTTATCTAAVREALRQFNTQAPIHAGTLIDTVDGQYEYALNDSDFTGLLDLVTVFYNDAPEPFHFYWIANAPFIRLASPLPAGTAILDVRFTLPHTINGLDSETESTLNADQDQVLVNGATAQCCYIRAADRIESVNVAGDTPAAWKNAGASFDAAFIRGLRRYTRRPIPTALPSTAAWNDRFTNWQV
jgi:hypothetical protein